MAEAEVKRGELQYLYQRDAVVDFAKDFFEDRQDLNLDGIVVGNTPGQNGRYSVCVSRIVRLNENDALLYRFIISLTQKHDEGMWIAILDSISPKYIAPAVFVPNSEEIDGALTRILGEQMPALQPQVIPFYQHIGEGLQRDVNLKWQWAEGAGPAPEQPGILDEWVSKQWAKIMEALRAWRAR